MFRDRLEAGGALAERLAVYAGRPDVLVLALPRGGVPVGYAVAHALRVALDIFLVRKLGLPGQPELAMGAIASGGVRVLNEDVVGGLSIPAAVIDRVAQHEQEELERRERAYREGRPALVVEGRTLILVDDGLATGSTMRAAALALRQWQPARIIAGVPVAAASSWERLRADVDEAVCLFTPEWFSSVGYWYENFTPTSDEEVRELLRRADRELLERSN
jgi:predicted phosphoribosyltransferase